MAAAIVVLLGFAACTPPIRQFDLANQALTCVQANESTYRTLQSMNFTVTEFSPAVVGRPGRLRGTREERGATQNVTVAITCNGRTADVDADEERKLLGRLEFKRGFYLAFTATAARAAADTPAARQEAARPPAQKKDKGLQVLLTPVWGLGAKLDFDLDLAAAGVLPVLVTMSNVTPRTYTFDPADVVLVEKDGTRVRPITVDAAADRVVEIERQGAAASGAVPGDRAEVVRRLQAQALRGHSLAANQSLKGYLFYPLAPYVKGRVALEDQASEETEGFVVEF
jgi:hypothetical protein